MKIEVVVPDESTGDVLGNLSSRRAAIGALSPRAGGLQVVDAMIPLAESFGYATHLRSMSQGRGTFTMEFERYDVVPPDRARKILGMVTET